jgi:alpha-tubulin suppressor-like RCC1 family protein
LRRAAPISLCLFALIATNASAAVMRWGYDGKTTASARPLTVRGLPAEAPVEVDAGNVTGFALYANGSEYAWGSGAEGQIGDGGANERDGKDAAVKVEFPAGVKIVAIGEARNSGYAVDSTGQGWGWGELGANQGCEAAPKAKLPEKIPGITDAVKVQGGQAHTLWILANGHVVGCGNSREGELGFKGEAVAPTEIPGLSGVVEVSAGTFFSLARTASGQVYGMGRNEEGQLCLPESVEKALKPVKLDLPGAASEISGGGNNVEADGHSMFLVEGVPYGCGADEQGELGDGQTSAKFAPTVASKVALLGLTQVVTGAQASAGISKAGEVYTWGSAGKGALGNGEEEGFSLTPFALEAGGVQLSATSWNMLVRG